MNGEAVAANQGSGMDSARAAAMGARLGVAGASPEKPKRVRKPKAVAAPPEKTVPQKQYDEAIEKIGKLQAENEQLRKTLGAFHTTIGVLRVLPP